MPLNHVSPYSALTDAQHAAIGRAVVEWANVEFLLEAVLARLLGTPEFLARTFTDSISAARIQEAVAEALEIHAHRYNHRLVSSELAQEILDANSRVTALRAMRNKFAHFCWMRSNDDEVFGTSFPGGVYSPRKERREYVTLSIQELARLNDESHALVENLMSIVTRLPEVTEESLLTNQWSRSSIAAAGHNHQEP